MNVELQILVLFISLLYFFLAISNMSVGVFLGATTIFIVLNTTFNNISAISWRPVLVVEKAGVPGENHRPWARN
jgi:hypothetical protein